MRIRYTEQAAANLEAIGDYLLERSPQAAARFGAALGRTLTNLAAFPRMGRLLSVPQIRKLVMRGMPYVIYYRADPAEGEIAILLIQHVAQERPFEQS